jgi:hypothetical protein
VDQLFVEGRVLVADDRVEHAVSDGSGQIGLRGQQVTEVDAPGVVPLASP